MKRTISLILMMAILFSISISLSESTDDHFYGVGYDIGQQIGQGLLSDLPIEPEGLAFVFGQRMADGMMDKLSHLPTFKDNSFVFRDTLRWGMDEEQTKLSALTLGWEYKLTDGFYSYYDYYAKELPEAPVISCTTIILPISGLAGILYMIPIDPSSNSKIFNNSGSAKNCIFHIIKTKYGEKYDETDDGALWILEDGTQILLDITQNENTETLVLGYVASSYQKMSEYSDILYNQYDITQEAISIF